MIPPLDPTTGTLPPGIYRATWDEVVTRFGDGEHRRRMLAGLAMAIEHLRAAGCQRLYLDGSFVSAKVRPGDYDACWDPTGVNLPRLGLLAPLLFDLEGGRRRQKEVYQGELLPATMPANVAGLPVTDVLELFQTDKMTRLPKGIIAIDLRGEA